MKTYTFNIIILLIYLFLFVGNANAQNTSILNCNNNVDDLSIAIVDESTITKNKAQFNLFCPVISPANGLDHPLNINTTKIFIDATDSCGTILEPVGIKIDENAYEILGYLDINITNSIEILILDVPHGIIRNDSILPVQTVCDKKVLMSLEVLQQDSLSNNYINNTYIETLY